MIEKKEHTCSNKWKPPPIAAKERKRQDLDDAKWAVEHIFMAGLKFVHDARQWKYIVESARQNNRAKLRYHIHIKSYNTSVPITTISFQNLMFINIPRWSLSSTVHCPHAKQRNGHSHKEFKIHGGEKNCVRTIVELSSPCERNATTVRSLTLHKAINQTNSFPPLIRRL